MRNAAVIVWSLLLVLTAVAQGPEELVRLDPELPLVLDRPWIQRLELFPEVPELESVRFQVAPWGGMVARLETPSRSLVRNLPADEVDALRERVRLALAGEPLPPWPAHTPPEGPNRAWPEAPAPPAAPPRTLAANPELVPIDGRWLAMIELGPRLDVTGFNEFFGPQVQFGVSFGYAALRQILPSLGFYAGFGDMRSDFESAFGDGRANSFGFVLNLQLRAGLSRTHALYLEGSGGYHIRSLYWGSAFVDPATGRIQDGRALEQSDLGWGVRVGWQLARATEQRPRLLDVGVGVQTMPASQWFLATEAAMFEASDRDTWIMLTFRIWDGL